MDQSPFVHLHVHTEYSLLDGAIRIKDLVARCRELGMGAVAITDHGSMHGVVKFYEAARKAGIKPILGCEFYVAPGSRHDKQGARSASEAARHLVLLAADATGYANLLKLSTLAQLEGFYYRPRIDRELLCQYNGGLIALTACLHGLVAHHIHRGQMEQAKDEALFLQGLFGDRLYLEIQENGMAAQRQVNDGLTLLSRELGIPLVATNDCHYLNREDAEAHQILLCIQTNKTVNDQDRFRLESDELYFKAPEDMKAQFAAWPEALSASAEIAARCNFELCFHKTLFPAIPVPEGQTLESLFEAEARQGLEERLTRLRKTAGFAPAREEEYRRRLDEEIEVILQKGFAGYFLIVADFIGWARKQDIPVGPGRGSAAGSLVAWCLAITDIDPILYGLFFERFLNRERKSLPDIDVDFCQERRNEVIDYVQKKFGGADHVAQIITFGSMKAKAALRDVGRALGMSFAETDRIAKLVPEQLGITLAGAIQQEPRLQAAIDGDGQVKKLLDIARALEGLARHASTHASAVVISPGPMHDYLPLYRGSKGEVLTQFDMKDTEKTGLIKFDFLGLKTLTVIDRALKLVFQSTGRRLDLAAIPLDDPRTYSLYSKGDTEGVFQMESSGMKGLAMKMKPDVFTDLLALVALYRPGPLGSGQIETFLAVKHGKRPASYPLPQIRGILEETYGVIVYQEQVMAIANILAGYSLGDADNLRRAMGKKIAAEMAKQKDIFLAGAEKNKIPADRAKHIFEQMETFAEYGFNKSHSAAYALVSYQTAYLKAHFSTEFMAALISCDMGDSDKVARYINECRDHDIKVLPPDINESAADFTVSDDRIRFGLAAVKNVGGSALENIIQERTNHGPYQGLDDFCRRLDLRRVNRRVLESLIKAGVMDCFGGHRSQYMTILDRAMEQGQDYQKKKASAQTSLFGGRDDHAATSSEDLPEMSEWEPKERLAMEKEMLGFYLTGHPLDRYEYLMQVTSDTRIGDLDKWETSAPLRLAGMISSWKRHTTKKNDTMAFAILEDQNAQVELVIFPDSFGDCEACLSLETPVLVTGQKEAAGEKMKLIVSRIVPIDRALDEEIESVRLRLDAASLFRPDLLALQNLVEQHPGGCPLTLTLHFAGHGEVDIRLPRETAVRPDQKFREEITRKLGESSLYLRKKPLESTTSKENGKNRGRFAGTPQKKSNNPGKA